MRSVKIQITVPEELSSYLNDNDQEHNFERNAMLIYPFIRNLIWKSG